MSQSVALDWQAGTGALKLNGLPALVSLVDNYAYFVACFDAVFYFYSILCCQGGKSINGSVGYEKDRLSGDKFPPLWIVKSPKSLELVVRDVFIVRHGYNQLLFNKMT